MVICSPGVDGGRWQDGQQAEGKLQLQQPRNLGSWSSSSSSSSSSGSSSSGSSCSSSSASSAPASRTLVYDVETGSLRFSKPSSSSSSCRASALQCRTPKSPRSPKLELPKERLGESGDRHCSSVPHSKEFRCEGFFESGESSPTCVIQNSTQRSNSSSPTMSTISKASSDADRKSLDKETTATYTCATNCKPLSVATRSVVELDEEALNSGPKSPRPELQKLGDVRERIKKLESINSVISGKPGLKGLALKRAGNESNPAKENATWATPLHDPSSNPPFKSIQAAAADSNIVIHKPADSSGMKKPRLPNSSIMHCHSKSPGIFSFNATYMSRPPDPDGLDFDFNDSVLSHSMNQIIPAKNAALLQQLQQQQQQQQLDVSRRNFLPLMKPTPSKWDDAEKWLPGSECQSAKAKSRSGPLLAQMVAAQAGMSIPWKGPQIVLQSQSERHHTLGMALVPRGHEAAEVDSSGSESVDVKDVHSLSPIPSSPPGPGSGLGSSPARLVDFTPDEKQQLNLLLDKYAADSMGSGEYVLRSPEGIASPSCLNGSFLKLGAKTDEPDEPDELSFSPASEDYDSKTTLDMDSKPDSSSDGTEDTGNHTTQEGDCKNSEDTADADSKPETRDMGTAMTPIPSEKPSRTSTPLRSSTHKPEDAAKPEKDAAQPEKDAAEKVAIVESPLTEKEFQEKTRQEIVALGNQLGKASIAAAWAAREKEKENEKEKEKNESAVGRRNSTLDLESLRRDLFASRAEAWQEAEKIKYTCRFEQDQAKIQAWEEHEKAKAEAELRRVERKAERMKSQATEKLSHRLATTQCQAEELRLAAEARRVEAAAKAAKKAEILKAHGKVTNLLFLSYLCT